jgi:hypothetical protein
MNEMRIMRINDLTHPSNRFNSSIAFIARSTPPENTYSCKSMRL